MKDRFVRVAVTKKAEHSIGKGHPWIYDTEVTPLGDAENGEIVDVFSQKGRWLGAGFYNANSKIRVRLLSRNANDTFDDAVFPPAHRLRMGVPQKCFAPAGAYLLPRRFRRGRRAAGLDG